MKIDYLGHAFFRISSQDTCLLIDPFFGRSSPNKELKCILKSSCCEKDMKNVALTLISHEHFDHFDKKAVESIALRNNAYTIGHESVLKELSLPANLLKSVKVGDELMLRGVKIKARPAHHPNSFYPLSYLIELEGKQIFHPGDTTLTDHFNGISPDVALLPIGGTFTMDLIDAVRATKTMKPKYAIPMHYNTFKQIQADPHEFKARIEKSIIKTKPIILKPGDSFEC